MSVKIEAEGASYAECLRRLGVPDAAPIEILWRIDFAKDVQTGFIVNVAGRPRGEFATAAEAAEFVSSLLSARERSLVAQRRP